MIELIKKITPQKIKKIYHAKKQKELARFVAALPKIDENDIIKILTDELNVRKGDMLFVHSSVGMLNLAFPSYNILSVLLELIGEEGTLIMPTYPKENSFNFLNSSKVFNIRKTPTYTGLLNEYARRHKNAVRSLHPTKSVVAIGKYAKDITCEHHLSVYPYSEYSPYYKINSYDCKVIGIGVATTYLSAVHCVDDTMQGDFPVEPYYNMIFDANCIDYDGNEVIVRTKAHDMSKMHFDLPAFFKKYADKSICKDITIDKMKFFYAESKPLYNRLTELVNDDITIYSKKFHKVRK